MSNLFTDISVPKINEFSWVYFCFSKNLFFGVFFIVHSSEMNHLLLSGSFIGHHSSIKVFIFLITFFINDLYTSFFKFHVENTITWYSYTIFYITIVIFNRDYSCLVFIPINIYTFILYIRNYVYLSFKIDI